MVPPQDILLENVSAYSRLGMTRIQRLEGQTTGKKQKAIWQALKTLTEDEFK